MIYLEYQLDLTMSYFFQVMSYEVVEGVAEVARVKQEVVQEVVQGAEGVTEECQTPGEGDIIRDHTPTGYDSYGSTFDNSKTYNSAYNANFDNPNNINYQPRSVLV